MSKKDKIRELIQKHLNEMSATGTGATVIPGEGEGVATKPAFGYKLVNRKALNNDAHSVDIRQLWKEETESEFDIESFISSLNTDDEEVKNYITGRLGDFNILAKQMKELISLLQKAKKETINSYRENPEKRSVYSTDLAIKAIDRVIKLFPQ